MSVSRALVVTAAATALVTSLALSASASGGSWLRLGGHNDASRTTTVDNHGRGPALQFRTRPGSPPLAVTSRKRVARLNADQIDGMHAQALRTQAYVYLTGGDEDEGPGLTKYFPGLPPGEYLVTYRMVFKQYDAGDVSCWFTTPTQTQAGKGTGYGGAYQLAVVTGSALLDAQHPSDPKNPLTLQCMASAAFDTPTWDPSNDSRATFLRIAPTQPRWATTYPNVRTGSSSSRTVPGNR
jgi:hypothetical protein